MEAAEPEAPAFLRLAAHPLRWRLLTALATSDYRVRELVELLDRPQNLVSYHLRLLRRSGLVTVRRSGYDARDGYHHLDLERCAHALTGVGAALHPALRPDTAPGVAPGTLAAPTSPAAPAAPAPLGVRPSARPRVLFACTGNSARSPVAAALLSHRSGGSVEAASAGSHPRARVHPGAVRVLREHYGIDIADHRPRRLDAAALPRFDQLVSLCDRVRETPELRARPGLVHWSMPDPADAGGADEDDRAAFRDMAAEIDTRVRHLLPVLTRVNEPEVRP
ncbi:arsenate reductase/protein-tyrosine-phosphatase family protein [Nocardiopsis aegyptia]|uniref:Protein-tyrosine-phosphatase/DNA-binding transcriptional ArsR family regulator n=1 Tax=Nocardiopsis aegyptia TaxID=220378 RepID=A0A7Z0EIK0_9ACTN|nr:ArsR family transcriptional regulator [Nocardiopsis aegyptia]NYJ32723.1 protein-tyrosine-phosphatase/DNA-binding transcriptional ArsR family regulator [Nocardiopsis aegyptia]